MSMGESDLIEYRCLNMDNGCRTSKDRLYKYASDFPGGMHRVLATGSLLSGPMLHAYGTRPYGDDAMIALDARLT